MFTGKHQCWSLFSITYRPEGRNFIKKRLQRAYFFVELAKLLRTLFFTEHIRWLLLEINSLFIAYERWISRYAWALQRLFYIITCVSLPSIFNFCYFFVDSTTCWGFAVRVSMLKESSGAVPRFLNGVLSGELLQSYLVVNITDLVQFGKNLCYILPPLAS